jgi:CO/xanthine dehydrogenase Mo-binding subunit
VRIEQTDTIPAEHHNPMEPHAAIARWDGPKLTPYDKTQGVDVVQRQAAQALGIPAENIRVVSPFVGRAFGSGHPPRPRIQRHREGSMGRNQAPRSSSAWHERRVSREMCGH